MYLWIWFNGVHPLLFWVPSSTAPQPPSALKIIISQQNKKTVHKKPRLGIPPYLLCHLTQRMVKHALSVVIMVLGLIPTFAFSPPQSSISSSQSTKPHSSALMSDNRFFSTTQINLVPIGHEQISTFLPSPMISADIKLAWSNAMSDIFQISGNVPFLPSLFLNAILFFSLRSKLMTMLTPEGFAHSLALGTMLWMTLGWRGWTVCVLYLFLGQLVTKVGFAEKESMGIAEKRGGRRGPENVWGSALTGVMCASAAAFCGRTGDPFLGLSSDVWILAYVASLATKIADTFASEIGKAYGKTTFLITTLKQVPPGTEGAVSLEGTFASVIGGFILSIYAYLIVGLIPTFQGVAVASFSAFVATMVESLIGATMQEKEGLDWMTNEVVNFFNTLIGATIALLVGSLILRY